MKHLLITTIAAVVLMGCKELDDVTSFNHAISNGDINRVKWFLAIGEDVNHMTSNGWTVLAIAAFANQIDVAKLLIEKGANVNQQLSSDQQGAYAVQAAIIKGHYNMVNYLIKEGANINAISGTGETSLDYSIRFNYSKITDLLRKHGAKTAEELKAEGK